MPLLTRRLEPPSKSAPKPATTNWYWKWPIADLDCLIPNCNGFLNYSIDCPTPGPAAAASGWLSSKDLSKRKVDVSSQPIERGVGLHLVFASQLMEPHTCRTS